MFKAPHSCTPMVPRDQLAAHRTVRKSYSQSASAATFFAHPAWLVATVSTVFAVGATSLFFTAGKPAV